MKEIWVSVGDNKVCPDCEALAGAVADSKDWDASGRPRERGTLCGDHCRCVLIGAPSEEVAAAIDELTEEVIDQLRVIVDETKGYKLALSEYADVVGLGELSYDAVARFEGLIMDYNERFGRLPKEFYDLKDIEKQIDWLEGKL